MNTKVTLLLLLVLLIILMLFYYIDLESNIIILLGVVIVLIIHNLITKKEHFNINEQSARLEAQIDSLTAVAEALRARSASSESNNQPTPIRISRSCPFNANTMGVTNSGVTAVSKLDGDSQEGLNPGFNTSLNQLTAEDIKNSFNESDDGD